MMHWWAAIGESTPDAGEAPVSRLLSLPGVSNEQSPYSYVANDHDVVRDGICALLSNHTGWEVCGEVVDGRQAVQQTKDYTPDLMILDLYTPSVNGMEAAHHIASSGSDPAA